MKCSVYIATSLDGCIARKNGDLDWLDDAGAAIPNDEDCGFAVFMESVDVLIMGRNTFDKVIEIGEWIYGDTQVIVLSRKPLDFSGDIPKTVSQTSEAPGELHTRLKEEGCQHAYIDGGLTIRRFLTSGLINEITISLIPTIIGEGIPLFDATTKDIKLNLIETRSYDFGFVQVKYSVDN